MLIKNYTKYIKGEHLKINRYLKLFTDEIAYIGVVHPLGFEPETFGITTF